MNPQRPAVNRADLLACLAAGGADKLARTAELAGFAAIKTQAKQPAEQTQPVPSGKNQTAPKSAPPEQTAAAPRPRARFHYVIAREILAPEDSVSEEPDWFRNAAPLAPEQQRGQPGWQAPSPSALSPWRRLWPVLRHLLGAARDSDRPDLPRLLAELGQGRQPRRIPWQPRHGWSPDCLLIIDYAPRLAMFWEDFQRLRRQLRKLRGAHGLRICELDGAAIPPLALPPPGAPVLILGDLGLHDPGAQARARWARLGRRLHTAGLQPLALLPIHRAQWHQDLAPWFRPLIWDTASRLPRQPQRRPGAEEAPPPRRDRQERLLTLLAPAVRIEAGLLRAVRALDARLSAREEAEVWRHPQARAGLSGFALDAAARQDYLRRFHELEPALRARVVALLRAHHAGLPPMILGEELRAAGVAATDAYFAQTLRSLLQQPDGSAMHAWARRVGGRYPAAAWSQDDIMSALWLVAHKTELRHGAALPPGLEPRRLAWLLGGGAQESGYALRQLGTQLFLQAETPGDAAARPGSLFAYVRAAAPFVRYGERIAAIDQALPLAAADALRLHTDREILTLASLEKPAWADAIGRDPHGLYAEFSVHGVTQRLRWIAPGRFLMGSPESEAERDDDERQHPVTLSQGYWLADTACTQALWRAVTGESPSRFEGDERPVEQVSWDDVKGVLEQLNQALPGLQARLPSEAEWEYACRAGTDTPFHFGANISPKQVNYDGNHPYADGEKGAYRGQTVPVKELPCNAWGLYQMHGNVWEWCEDWFGDYPKEPVSDPPGPESGEYRVLRGGSWYNLGRDVRAAYRFWGRPDERLADIGFRLARGQSGRGEE